MKALVLLEPFGAPFDREALTSLMMPVLLYRAEQSDLRPDGNIFALASALPRPPRQESVPGGHLIFVDPCPPALVRETSVTCKDIAKDAAGVDRAAILRQVEADVADFLRKTL